MTPQQTVDFLNQCLGIDYVATNTMFRNYVGVNDSVINGPHLLISDKHKAISVLGLLNSILCRGQDRIQVVHSDDSYDIIRFQLTTGHEPLPEINL